MEYKISKGCNYKRVKKGLKRKHGNSGTENFVHPPPFKLFVPASEWAEVGGGGLGGGTLVLTGLFGAIKGPQTSSKLLSPCSYAYVDDIETKKKKKTQPPILLQIQVVE